MTSATAPASPSAAPAGVGATALCATPHAVRSRLRRTRVIVLLVSLAVAAPGVAALPARAAEPARTPAAQPAPPTAEDPGGPEAETATPVDDQVLIRYAPGSSVAERRAVRREHGLTTLRTGPGGRTDVVTAAGRSTATIRRQLEDDPAVVAVAPNHRRQLAEDVSAEPAFDDLWGLHNTGQRIDGTTDRNGRSDIDIDGVQALKLGLGRGDVVVAVIDDGVDFGHVDLAERAWTNPGEAGEKATNGIDDDGNGYVDDVHGWDFCNDDATVHDAGEDGHGTHVAGTIAGSLNGTGVVGVAPGVRIMAIKFIDDSDYCGSDAQAVAAIDYAASFGVRIINASWGGSQPSAVLDAAIAESGALFVAAAGNWGVDLDAPGGYRFYPASSSLPNIVSVAAADQSGALAAFSNRGRTSVDLAAPGTNILSTYPAIGDCPSSCYVWSDGTSMATPHVAGVAALAASAHRSLLDDPLKLRSRLLATGQALDGGTGWSVTGRMVNAFRAVDAAPPTVSAPNKFAVKTGTVVGTSSVPAVVGWPAAKDSTTWIARYDLKRRSTASWKTVEIGPKATSVVSRLTYGTSYTYRLSAQDAPRNTGGPVDSPAVVTSLHSDSSSLATYGSGWRRVTSSSATGLRLHTSSTKGASMSFSFSGRSFALVAPKGPTRGSIKVYVDGTLKETVSLYRSTSQAKVVVFSTAWTTKTKHRIKVVVAGSRRVDIDGFVVVR